MLLQMALFHSLYGRIRLPMQEMRVNPWFWKISQRRESQPTPVLLPGKCDREAWLQSMDL